MELVIVGIEIEIARGIAVKIIIIRGQIRKEIKAETVVEMVVVGTEETIIIIILTRIIIIIRTSITVDLTDSINRTRAILRTRCISHCNKICKMGSNMDIISSNQDIKII